MEAAAVPSHARLPPIPASRKIKPRAPVPPLMRSQSETGPPNSEPPDQGGGGDCPPLENVELNVILPGGEHHMAHVDGSKPVMDLLIVLCGRYRLSPAGHTLELLSRENASPLQYKPNTPLGALCAGTALLKPRAASDERLKKPMQPVVPEQTVRLMVNYLRTQKTMVRVSPRVALQDLLPEICNKCEFSVPHTTLFRDTSETELLDTSCSLSELGIKEVYAVDRSKVFRHHRTGSSVSFGFQEQNHGLNDSTDLPEKENKGLLSFLRPKKKKSDDDVSECGTNSSMHGDSSRDTSMPGTPLMGQQHHQRPMSMPCVPYPMLGTLPSGSAGGSKGPCGVLVAPEGPRKRRAPAPPLLPTNPLATTPIPEDREPHKDNENLPSKSPGSQDSGFEQVCRDHVQSSPDQPRLTHEPRRSRSTPAPLGSSPTEAAGATSPLAMLQHRTKRRAPPPPPCTTGQAMQVGESPPPTPRSALEQASAVSLQPGSPPPVHPRGESQNHRRSSSTASTQSSGSIPLKDENKEGVSERPTPVKPPRGSQASPPLVVPSSPLGIPRDPPQFQAPPPPPYPPPPEPTTSPPAPPHAIPSVNTAIEKTVDVGGMGSDSNVIKGQRVPEAAPRKLEQRTTVKTETHKTIYCTSQQSQVLADNMVQECSSDLVQTNRDAEATAEFDELIAELEMGLTDDDFTSKASPPTVETVKVMKEDAEVNLIIEPVEKLEAAVPDSTAIKATTDSSSNNSDKVAINNEAKGHVLSTNANVATDVKRGPSKKALQFIKAYNDLQKKEAANKNKTGNVQEVFDKPPVNQKKEGNEVKIDFLAKVQKSAQAQQRDHISKTTLCGSFSEATAKASGCVVGEEDPRRKRLSMAFPDISTKSNYELSRSERHGGSLKVLDKMPVQNETFINACDENIHRVRDKPVDKQVKTTPVERYNVSSEQYKKQPLTQKQMTHEEECGRIQPVEIQQETPVTGGEQIVDLNTIHKVILEERPGNPSEKVFPSESIKNYNVSVTKSSQPVTDRPNELEASMQNSIFYKRQSISKESCSPEAEYQDNSGAPSSPVLPVYKQPSDRWRSTNEITRDYLPKVGLTTYRIVPSKPALRPKPETADVPFFLPTDATEPSKTENANAVDATNETKEKLKNDSLTVKTSDVMANAQHQTAHQSPMISPTLSHPSSDLSKVTRPFQRSHSLQYNTETISQQRSAVRATEPLASIATSPPSSSKHESFFRPGRRTSSLYVASAIAKKTAYKSSDTPNESYSGTTPLKTTPVDALPPLKVNCEQDELIIPPPPEFSTEENANVRNAPDDPGKVIIIEAPRVHQWKPKQFRPVSFPSAILKDDKSINMNILPSHLEYKNTVFAVKSPPPVMSKSSSGFPFNIKSASSSSQIQSVLSSPKSTDASPFYQPPTVLNTTGTALESPSLIYEQRKSSCEDTGLFGPMLKLKPVVQKPIQKDDNPHTSLMEALQSTDNMGRLRKVSGASHQKVPSVAESETERDALLAAIRSGAGGKGLRKTSSTAAEELVSQRLREADSGDSATLRLQLASVPPPVPAAPPPPPPPLVTQMGNGARSTECSPEEARLAMLDAIRSGSCAGMLKKVPKSVNTIEVNGKSGTIRSSSS